MHYYQFNIGDYRKDTQHLTMIEHYIYRELLDWMNLDETAIPKDLDFVTRRLRLDNDCSTDVQRVFNEFFIEREDGYYQERVFFEINEYKVKQLNAVKAGKASAKARKVNGSAASERSLNGRTTNVQPTINHKPLTINHIKDSVGKPTKRKQFKPPSSDEVRNYLAEKNNTTINPDQFLDFYAARGWKLSSGTKMADWKAAVRTWINREGNQNAKVRSGRNTGTHGAKLTPAQRTAAKREELQRRELAQ